MSSRGWIWLQLAIAWLPMWALFTLLIVLAHETPLAFAAARSLSMIAAGAVLGVVVYKFTERMPWPYPFRLRFVASQVLAAAAYAVCWWLLISAIDSIVHGHLTVVVGPGVSLFLATGIWLYVVVAGVAYANRAAQRSARIEAQSARAQLDALRTQLHPHFLFNALHTVVQLIPFDPRGAARAAEQLAGALRTTIEERRDLVTLAEEWAFVERYLAIERIRFGERLVVDERIPATAREALLPSFALQTLVENAVRHGAAPRAQPTHVAIVAEVTERKLVITVADDGAGASSEAASAGTGLRRLRERMHWLYGDRAQLDVESAPAAGFRVTLRVPLAEPLEPAVRAESQR
jgi:hypothetical protein